MCQDPEISFVIVLPFKRKQFAYYLSAKQLFTDFWFGVLFLSNSLYFLAASADVTACLLLKASLVLYFLKDMIHKYTD